MGEPTRGGRAESFSRDQKLRREWGLELVDISICKKNIQKKKERKKVLARKKRSRDRAGLRAALREASNDRNRDCRRELVIATHNVRTMTVDGKHGAGRAAEVLGVDEEMDCGIDQRWSAGNY